MLQLASKETKFLRWRVAPKRDIPVRSDAEIIAEHLKWIEVVGGGSLRAAIENEANHFDREFEDAPIKQWAEKNALVLARRRHLAQRKQAKVTLRQKYSKL